MPQANRVSWGEPNKFCRPSEQKGAPTLRFIWGACPANRRAGETTPVQSQIPLFQRARNEHGRKRAGNGVLKGGGRA
ncbi:hypothetical protein QQ96_23515 [Salmonella enterica subsp. enterica serovar Newport]|nr:hypothetical protein [Salmonella enterica subsp. enterica serovar Newport]